MKSTVSGIEPQVGRWDYDGACSPAASQRWGRHTFSVGVFCWEPKARGGGAKRGKSVCRVVEGGVTTLCPSTRWRTGFAGCSARGVRCGPEVADGRHAAVRPIHGHDWGGGARWVSGECWS